MYGWIIRHLPDGPKPPIYRPFNYVRIVAVTTSVLGVITFLSVASPYILPVIRNRNLWAAISLIIILLFTSGHMFNHIRKVPYVSGNGKGGISYFAGGFSSQFGLETQIVAAMCRLTKARSLSFAPMCNQPWLTTSRWCPFVCNNRPCFESSAHGRPQEATGSCLCLGGGDVQHVQLSDERVSDQKRRVSFSPATFLSVCVCLL